jgi:GWxTD domain-containing protein
MRYCFFLVFLSTLPCAGQAVSSINYSYWYNPQTEVDVQINPVMKKDSIVVFYKLTAKNPASNMYSLQWEKKDSYSQRQGAIIVPLDSIHLTNGIAEGQFVFAKPEKPWVLVGEVVNRKTSKGWFFFKQIEAHYPVNGYLEKGGEKQFQSYKLASEKYIVRGSGSGLPIHFSFYKDNFPSPSPPFAEKEFKMDRFLFPDSTFTIAPGTEIGPFKQEGLYLAQEDTLSSLGFSFLIKREPYPRFNKIADLKGPLLFVTTREENDKIGAAGEDKTKFDKVILDITNDKDRAKKFMRNFFRRVEIANQLFTTYKEGWKTDRGMIYIVFGPPDEVATNGQQEVWAYKYPHQSFRFTKSGSVYNPDHYVLVRDNQYAEDWYTTIDVWRKSQF